MLSRLRNRLAAAHLLHKSRRPYTVETDAGPVLVLPGVLDPVATKVGCWLAGVMRGQVKPGEPWVDMGGGTGVVGLAMAQAGASVRCVDINPAAVQNAQANAVLRGVDLAAVQNDLLTGLEPPFGVVYNVPFWPGDGTGRPFGEAMYAGPAFEAIRAYRRSAEHVPRVLIALSEAGPRHAEARLAFGSSTLLHRERVRGEWLIVLEAETGR